jgi:hypothetical protein
VRSVRDDLLRERDELVEETEHARALRSKALW